MSERIPVNILLVDDQPGKLLTYESVLADLGEKLVRAGSGAEALEHLLREEYAVVLVNVCMPDLNGFELASMIREHPRCRRTAVLLVSGVMVEDMDRIKGYDSGAVDYLSVPIVPGILRAKVSVFAELYRKTLALERLNNELEQRVADATAFSEGARREAENANRMKDEFLATLSHELRTPLHVITGWAHLMKEGGLEPEETSSAIEAIQRSAHLQTQLVADLLDVSRIASGKLRLDCSWVDLRALVETAVEASRPQAAAKGVAIVAELGAEPLPRLQADPARLHQVLNNLLSNAVKFTPGGGHVRLSLNADPERMTLTVADDGPGIAPAFMPHVFDRFRQADTSSSRAQKGLGLGLTIARHLVEMHGGKISVANRQPGPGAVFTVGFPVPAESGMDEPTTEAAPVALSRHALQDVRVLVVDDEADGREIAARLLERCGAETLVAASAGEALNLLQRERPDVLVADIEMPGEDGYSLLRRLRSLPIHLGGQTPAIALTAYAGVQDRNRMLAAGFQRHIAKPVFPTELVAAVAALAGSRRAAADAL